MSRSDGAGTPTLLLVACVKKKLSEPAAARDLYTSPLFRRQREYAETAALPWYILSAERGLVDPDEWLSPYERSLADVSPSYRRSWADWVVARLELLAGPLSDQTIEVHAGALYLDALRRPLTAKGARLLEPLAGLRMGERLAWYARRAEVSGLRPASNRDLDSRAIIAALSDKSVAVRPAKLRGKHDELKRPGVYTWWVDARGATDLSDGLGQRIRSGLIYAGSAGATRWPSGKRSRNTLWTRINGMHLGGNHEFSTFRRSLGAVLAAANREETIHEDSLTDWMGQHLRVVTVPVDDADTLSSLEHDVLRELDPPLNLSKVPRTDLRRRLTELRGQHVQGRQAR